MTTCFMGKSKKNLPKVMWYGYYWKMTAGQINKLVKIYNAGGSVSAAVAALGAMGVVTAIGSAAAAFLAATLWAAGAILDLYHDLAGKKGLTIRVTWVGAVYVLPK